MAISYDEAGNLLDTLIEELPPGIFHRLNGGVNLIEDTKRGENGDYILGLYHVNDMGRYVEIFYGSFVELFGDVDEDKFREELRVTLHHELTHHLENMAGDKTLERWDEEQALDRLYGYVEADSILFVDDDGEALAPMACAMLQTYGAGRIDDVTVSCACIDGFSGKFLPEASQAAREMGAYFPLDPVPTVSDILMKDYNCILCMTERQNDELSARFPQFAERIMTLGVTDIRPPLFKKSWRKTADRMKEEIGYLIEELCEGQDD